MRRINPQLEQQILTQILLGYPYADVALRTGVAVSTIKKVKMRNKTRFQANQNELEHWTAEEAKTFLQSTYVLLNRILAEVEQGTRVLSVKEIVLISNQMLIHERVSTTALSYSPLINKQQNINTLLSKLKKR